MDRTRLTKICSILEQDKEFGQSAKQTEDIPCVLGLCVERDIDLGPLCLSPEFLS